MKVNLFCIFFFIAGICAFANHPAPSDTLITVDNDTIVCKRIQIEESSVSYVKAGQSVEFSLDKKFIKYVSTPKQAEKNSTIVTVGGDVIACNIEEENDMVVKYRELGKSAEYVLDKSQIATLVRPDGNVESYAGGEFQTGRHEKETSPVPEKIPAGTECRITTTKGEVIDCKIEDDNGSRIKYRKQGGSIVFILPKDEMESVELSKDAGYERSKEVVKTEDKDKRQENAQVVDSSYFLSDKSGLVSFENNKLYLDGVRITEDEYMKMCSSMDMNLWNEYKKGKKRYKAASWILCSGSLCMLASSILFICDSYIAGGIFIGIGGVLAITSIPLYFKGNDLRVESVENYNVMKKAKSRTVASLDFGVSDAGVGLALRF